MIHAVPKPPAKSKKAKTHLKVNVRIKVKNKNPLPTKTRDKAFVRDGNQCLECGAIDGLHPHHVKRRSEASKVWVHDLRNLWTMCWLCHGKTEGGTDSEQYYHEIQRKAVARFNWFAGQSMTVEEWEEKYGDKIKN